MIWWSIFFVVTGFFIGVCPYIISKNVKKCSSEDVSEAKEAESRVNRWLLFSYWAIIFASAGFAVESGLAVHKEVTELREQVSELTMKVDLLTEKPQADALSIKNYLEGE